jgi:7-cyano-7-deazaguanine synthase in queuosine biosynthesis
MTQMKTAGRCPTLKIEVVEQGERASNGWLGCEIGRHVRFSTEALESYFFEQWQPVVFDLLLVAAVVEFCDRHLPRPEHGWARRFNLRLPVHDATLWSTPAVSMPLHQALSLLTGDFWSIEPIGRKSKYPAVRQTPLPISAQAEAVMAFSNGLDSRAVAGLVRADIGDGLVRIRLGRDAHDTLASAREHAPFTSIPYRVGGDGLRMPETSARSRGFKFAVITLVGAHLAKVDRVIVPESGQGALGPALVPVGHAYADYRNHPRFTGLVEVFGESLLGHRVRYQFPRLWFTKAETLAAYRKVAPDDDVWSRTWSCWQQSRHVSVDGHKRQCGICAACMLRRLSIHAAGLKEDPSRYVWENLAAADFEAGAAVGFPAGRIGPALREYALAGTLHLQHLAELGKDERKLRGLTRAARQIGRLLRMDGDEIEANAIRLVKQHGQEWNAFVGELGAGSFVNRWVRSS